MQLCLQIELAEENHFAHRSHRREHNKNVIKKFGIQARNRPEIFWQTSSPNPAWPEKLGPTYNPVFVIQTF